MIQSLNSPLHVKFPELVSVELQRAPLPKVSGSLQSLENDRDHRCLLEVGHQDRRHALNVLIMRRKNSPRLAREVGPAANAENVLALAEREVGPAYDNKGIGSYAREVGPAANSVEVLGSAKREVGPAATPGDERPGSDDSIQHGCHPKTKPGKYGVISLFDGVSSVVRVLTKKLGCPPTAILLAENDESIRRLVCTEFGYRTDEKWGYTASGSACLYISDVHKLAENDCLLLRPTCSSVSWSQMVYYWGGPHVRTSPMLDTYMVY